MESYGRNLGTLIHGAHEEVGDTKLPSNETGKEKDLILSIIRSQSVLGIIAAGINLCSFSVRNLETRRPLRVEGMESSDISGTAGLPAILHYSDA